MTEAKKNTVKQQIFIMNTAMVLVILGIAFIVNYFFAKLYLAAAESDFEKTLQNVIINHVSFEDAIEAWTIKRHGFLMIFSLDILICIMVFLFVSFIFTKKLSHCITQPLDELTAGADRVKKGNLSQNIIYKGLHEFETACENFNDMQKHILDEQTKNLKYEKARTDMVAGISHDLRTPLTAIQGTLKGLIDDIVPTPEIKQRFLTTAYTRSLDMEKLIEKLFFFSKMETGNMPLNVQSVNLSQFFMKYINGKRKIYSSDEITFIYEQNSISDDDVTLMIDSEQMTRIFDNLIENSIKYADADMLTVTISLTQKERDITIIFADNGIGVPNDKLAHIFDEFYRCDESRNKKEGNGLGLYIAKHLITEMNGNISAANENGLNIFISFPRAAEN